MNKTLCSPVGPLLLSANEEGLTHLLIQNHLRVAVPDQAGGPKARRWLEIAEIQLGEYFHSTRSRFDLPLAPTGTEFQMQVWMGLRNIPFGTTLSYQELAGNIQRPQAVRAVGAANGANPISIIVPCHRVIGKNGQLTGFGGGLEAKAALLKHEQKMI